MTIHVQDAEAEKAAPDAPVPARDERRTALVLLVCVVIAIAMIGLLLDSVTESFAKKANDAREVPVAVVGGQDEFNRPNNPATLGKADSGQTWRAVAGQWGIQNGAAFVSAPADGPSLVTIPVGSPAGRVEVTFETVAAGSGFAFRCKNALNCWRVEAVPSFGTWNVIKSKNGNETRVANLGTVPVAPGTKVAVELDGAKQEYFVDGKSVKTVEDTDFAFETRAGLSLREPAGAQTARWASFIMTPNVKTGIINADEIDKTGGVADEFARASENTLGTAPTGQRWESVAGTFGAVDGMAAPTAPAKSDASLALVDAGSADGIVQSTMLSPQKDSGIAFRCRDAANCYRLEVVPGFGTWNVYKVENGKATSIGNVGVTATAPGTTISVELRGPSITVYVNGEKSKTFTDTTFATETRAGLVVNAGEFSRSTRWSDFLFKPVKSVKP